MKERDLIGRFAVNRAFFGDCFEAFVCQKHKPVGFFGQVLYGTDQRLFAFSVKVVKVKGSEIATNDIAGLFAFFFQAVEVGLRLCGEGLFKVLSKAFMLNKQKPWNETVYVAFFAVYLPDLMLEH